jgi:hypothetical protein
MRCKITADLVRLHSKFATVLQRVVETAKQSLVCGPRAGFAT